jgi:hypothetical protein
MGAQEQLSDEERELLGLVVDTYQEGIEEAKKVTTEDRMLETPEELLGMCAGYSDTEEMLGRIRIKLQLGGKE